MRPGPDPHHAAPLPKPRRKKRRERPRPPIARATAELAVVLIGLAGVIAFVPLSSWKFPWACGVVCVLAGGYAVYGAWKRPGMAEWWGFTWGGRDADDLAGGLWNTFLLFFAALVPIGFVKLLVSTPTVLHPVAYLFWCAIQDFLFFSLVLRGIERLTAGRAGGNQHLTIWLTAGLFGLSHYPMTGFILVTALIGVLWGYIFVRTRLLWPVTALHFVLGLLVMA